MNISDFNISPLGKFDLPTVPHKKDQYRIAHKIIPEAVKHINSLQDVG